MNGLELIKHTAGGGVMTATTTGGSVKYVKNGKIEFTDAAQVHVDKCFDVPVNPGDEPLYDNYLIVMRHEHSGNTSMGLRLRRNGANAPGSSYNHQYILADDGTVLGSRTASQNEVRIGPTDTPITGNQIYLYGPNLSQPTATRNVSAGGLSGAYILDYAGTHSVANPYDGCSIISLSGTFVTGSLTIYGFTKGTP